MSLTAQNAIRAVRQENDKSELEGLDLTSPVTVIDSQLACKVRMDRFGCEYERIRLFAKLFETFKLISTCINSSRVPNSARVGTQIMSLCSRALIFVRNFITAFTCTVIDSKVDIEVGRVCVTTGACSIVCERACYVGSPRPHRSSF